jgi:hypothetical protein
MIKTYGLIEWNGAGTDSRVIEGLTYRQLVKRTNALGRAGFDYEICEGSI